MAAIKKNNRWRNFAMLVVMPLGTRHAKSQGSMSNRSGDKICSVDKATTPRLG